MSLILGIDIGTTSVKCVVVKQLANSPEILTSVTKNTGAWKEKLSEPFYKEQDVIKILKAVDFCVFKCCENLTSEKAKLIRKITICGQMHGCVLWNKRSQLYPLDESNHVTTSLYTWQDQRCDDKYLQQLPLSLVSATPLSTGYGSATLIWHLNYQQSIIKNNNFCGTIADYLVFVLCWLNKTIMSTHNATSWGYFNASLKCWDYEMFSKVNFPKNLLPEVVDPCTIVGRLQTEWYQIPKDTDVYVALGDLQCSVLSCRPSRNDAVVNISTSAQISKISQKEDLKFTDSHLPASLLHLPYFDDLSLQTFASLNGGDAVSTFIRMVWNWTKKFSPDVTFEQIYEEMETGTYSEDSTMRFNPTIFGERHNPSKKGSLSQISETDLDLNVIFHQLLKGIADNLRDTFIDIDYQHVWACGGVFSKSPSFRRHVLRSFSEKSVSFDRNCDAAFGAALSVFENFNFAKPSNI